MVIFHVIAVCVTVVLVFVEAEGVLALILVAVVLVAVPLTFAVLLVVGPLKSWQAYVVALLLHAVPCLRLPVSTGRFVVGLLLHCVRHLLLHCRIHHLFLLCYCLL